MRPFKQAARKWQSLEEFRDHLAWEATRHLRVKVRRGAAKASRKILIYMIYQPDGIAASVYETIDHFIEQGYAPFVVSNAPIRDEDARRLSRLCWRIMTRPNIGHDFGAYRDAILHLGRHRDTAEFLVVLNDSVWFPIFRSDDHIRRMELAASPVVGMTDGIQITGRRRPPEDPYGVIDGTEHVTSWLFMLKQPALGATATRKFWSGYRLRRRKADVINYGEIGHSTAMLKAGFAWEAIYAKKWIIRDYTTASREEILRRIANLTSVLPRHAVLRERVLSDPGDAVPGADCPDPGRLLERMLWTTSLSDTLAYDGIKTYGFPFIKKTVLRDPETKSRFLRRLEAEALDLRPSVRAELTRL